MGGDAPRGAARPAGHPPQVRPQGAHRARAGARLGHADGVPPVHPQELGKGPTAAGSEPALLQGHEPHVSDPVVPGRHRPDGEEHGAERPLGRYSRPAQVRVRAAPQDHRIRVSGRHDAAV